MWLTVGVLFTAEASPDQIPTATVVAGLIALVSAVIAAWLGARGTLRTADVQREANHDKRVDERNTYLETRNEELVAERDHYRELFVQLRVAVFAVGLDPDNLGEETP